MLKIWKKKDISIALYNNKQISSYQLDNKKLYIANMYKFILWTFINCDRLYKNNNN